MKTHDDLISILSSGFNRSIPLKNLILKPGKNNIGFYFHYAGFGEKMPVAGNETEKGKMLNRRVVFEIM